MRRYACNTVIVAMVVTRWSYNLTMILSIIAREEMAKRLEPWMAPRPVVR